MALGAASVHVWVGQVRMYRGDHVLFWWKVGLGLWPVHGVCAPSSGKGGRIHLQRI